jgi:hypothetical protein
LQRMHHAIQIYRRLRRSLFPCEAHSQRTFPCYNPRK